MDFCKFFDMEDGQVSLCLPSHPGTNLLFGIPFLDVCPSSPCQLPSLLVVSFLWMVFDS